jgi:SAM-dependent methyltransferase
MHEYERRFYDFQTTARGRLTDEALRKEFAAVAPWYQKRLGPYLPEHRDAAILDCPCGYGNILYFLREAGYTNVTGIDLDPKQVELARLLELPAAVGDALAHLQEHPDSLDAILSVDFLEHLDRDGAVRFLELARAALRPGGVLIARTPCADGPFGAAHRYNDITHQWAMTAVCADGLLRMTGFDSVTILDERPQRTGRGLRDHRKIAAFHVSRYVAKKLANALTGSAPKIWSRSMWVIGRRDR